ncbi:hypothetical protein GCM10011511_39130 [Puia dinghuensis]|uniref:Uncharacterized protein n=1 Tax=Puia dinghuensis TaxID=1792502 RepID=A0A8J2UFW0_9BACT|nr:hypothetical protein GCM10011511_39130 [Puia dinghuensis]
MAGFAFDIKLRRLHAFVLMPIMATEAGHFTILKTFAGGKHAVLIAVYIYFRHRFCRILLKEVEQLITWLKAKGRPGL